MQPAGASTYSYSSSSAIVSPSVNSTFTITGTAATGCSNSAICQVSLFPGVQLFVSATNNNLCGGRSVTLTASGAQSYSWNTNPGQNSYVITPTVTSTYLLVGTDKNGCIGSMLYTQNVYNCTGTSENELGQMSIYPNPSNGVIFFTAVDISKQIKIYNQLGELVLDSELLSGQNMLQLRDQPSGAYLVAVSYNNQTRYQKLILSK
jgi:hypothetical protein